MIQSSGVIGSISLSNPNETIYIYGAGFTGLCFGYYLKKNGRKVKIFETNTIGGKIGSDKSSYGISEKAANALYTSPEILELVRDLNLEPIRATKNLKKKIYRLNKARSFPFALWEIPKVFFGLFKKVPKKENQSVFDFFSNFLGEKLTTQIIGSIFNGVYATPIKELHFKSIFKQQIQAKRYLNFFLKAKKNMQKGYSISFKNGLQELIDALKNELKDEIQITKHTITKMQQSIICTDAPSASALLKEHYPSISKLLNSIDYTCLHSTTVFRKNEIKELENSFGMLFPYNEQQNLGILNNSAIFNRPSNYYSYTYISKNKPDIKEFESANHYFWQRALPVYNLKRFQTIQKIRSEFYNLPPRLVIHGNYVDGISLRDILKHIRNFTDNIPNKENVHV